MISQIYLGPSRSMRREQVRIAYLERMTYWDVPNSITQHHISGTRHHSGEKSNLPLKILKIILVPYHR